MKFVHHVIEEQVARMPHAPAVIFRGQQLDYAELNQRANRLAHYLMSRGVAPESLVGVYLDRSLEMAIAILGVLKAGAAYLPLDPTYPSERISYMARQGGAQIILTQSSYASSIVNHARYVAALDELEGTLNGFGLENPQVKLHPENLAYVIYTSGSTGAPKGAMVPHRALWNHMDWMLREFPMHNGDRLLHKTPFSFDAAVWEYFAPLMSGAVLVMAEPLGHRDVGYLIRTVVDQQITILQMTPSLLMLMAEHPEFDRCVSLRRLVSGGEALTTRLAQRVLEKLDVELVNCYGPAEAAIDTIYYVVQRGEQRETIPIGQPVDRMQAYILDDDLNSLPDGEIGELYLAGESVGRGYLNRPDLTAERFLPDPFSNSGRIMYRTGDLGRRRRDGLIEYLGRVDFQVKVGGARVEIGEIEAALQSVPGVRQAAVILQAASGEDGIVSQRLAAYLTLKDGFQLSAPKLRTYLSQLLPVFMIPSTFVQIEAMPLNPSGKIDRKALERTKLPKHKASSITYHTFVEEKLARIWSQVLGAQEIQSEDDFFELGGHSLAVIQTLARILDEFQVELPIDQFFTHPTLGGMAARIESAMAERIAHTQAVGSSRQTFIPRAPRDRPLPVSFAQEQVWFIHNLAPDNLAYNYQILVHLQGKLDRTALEKTLSEIVRRHEIYRTTFPAINGEPMQVIHPPWQVNLPVFDLNGLTKETAEEEMERLLAEWFAEPFDITSLPLTRWRLIRMSVDEHYLVHMEHHLVHDGWSFGVLMKEIRTLYPVLASGGIPDLSELPAQFADYAIWQRQTMQGETLENLLAYWKKRLEGSPPVLDLPIARPRPRLKSYRGASIQLDLSPQLYAAAKHLGRLHRATTFMTLLTVFKTLIYRYTGQTDVLIASGFANRQRRELESMIGMVVNTVILRTDFSGDLTFSQALERVRETVLEAASHQDLPFEKLVEALQPKRDLSYNPIYQIVFSFHDSPIPELDLPELHGRLVYRQNQSAKFDLNVVVIPRDAQLLGLGNNGNGERVIMVWEYDTDLFDRSTIERMIAHFIQLLKCFVDDPTQKLSEVNYLSPDEMRLLIEDWNATAHGYPNQATIHSLFETQAAETPQAIAVELARLKGAPKEAAGWIEQGCLTYAELNRRANQLAHYLIRLGVGRETVVSVFLDRSIDLIVSLLAILKAGAAYAPLETNYPQERLAWMLNDLESPIVITWSSLAERLPLSTSRVIFLDGEQQAIESESVENPYVQCETDNLAYVMYTSGSTGRPKGVCIPHRGVIRLVKGANYARFASDEVFLQFAPSAFDASTFEILGSLLNGARLVVFPAQDAGASLAELGEVIRKYNVTTLWLTAGLFHQLVDYYPQVISDLRQLLAGGDVLSTAHVRKALQAAGNCRIINGYGPTENTTFTTTFWVQDESELDISTPIGKPIDQTQVYILDDNMRPTPIGVPGELYTGGDGLARGYLHQPQLTAERFVPNPFARQPGERLYRTGDWAKYRSDGTIEFLGRKDDQVKIRGFRVEPGEVEAMLMEHPLVRQAAVIVWKDDDGDEKRLAAYVACNPGANITAQALRAYLGERLPEHMLPAAIIILDDLPLSANGKVDRKALPRPRVELLQAGEAERPLTPLERAILGIWAETLKIDHLRVDDNFFDLGGHSLTAIRLAARISEVFGIDLPLRVIFEAPTPAAFSAALLRAADDVDKLTRIAEMYHQLATLSDEEAEAMSFRRPSSS
jgi:amino acid adenylation domain-containing protein